LVKEVLKNNNLVMEQPADDYAQTS